MVEVSKQRGVARAAHLLHAIPGGDEHGRLHPRAWRQAPVQPHARSLHGKGETRPKTVGSFLEFFWRIGYWVVRLLGSCVFLRPVSLFSPRGFCLSRFRVFVSAAVSCLCRRHKACLMSPGLSAEAIVTIMPSPPYCHGILGSCSFCFGRSRRRCCLLLLLLGGVSRR